MLSFHKITSKDVNIMIEVLENVDCAPNIIELQKVSTFIYIDNVLCQDEFNIFYPKDIKKQKKVKLLLSTVDINGVYA